MIEKLIEKERMAEKNVAILSFIAMTVLVSINVFARYFLKTSFVFTEELAYVFFNWFVLIGVCNIFRKHGLVAVDVFVNALPLKIAKANNLLVDLIVLGTNVVLTYLSVQLAITGYSRKTPALTLPYTIMYLPAVISFAVMSISSINMVIQDCKGMRKEEADHE